MLPVAVEVASREVKFEETLDEPAPGGALHIVTLQYATHVANGAGVLYFPSGCAIEKAGP